MKDEYYTKYLAVERDYWWFKGRRDMILRLLRRTRRDARILDIGCSGGILMESLAKAGFTDVAGIDVSARSIKECRRRGIRKVQVMDAARPRSLGKFDVLIASDVLEHIKDDALALERWRTLLAPGGRLILFVPAFNLLWSPHDDANMHHRRYTRRQLVLMLRRQGYAPLKSSYWNVALFFPMALARLLQRAFHSKGGDQLHETGAMVNAFLTGLLSVENSLIELIPMPVGVSVMVLARAL
jgi:SAM-dependent methyltransferase